MDKIDIAMTATLRPNLINRTLESIYKNIVQGDNDRYRLIINVDRIGEDVKQRYIVKKCKKYFNNILFNYPEIPSFPKAVKWVWEQADTNFIFHIEDDWIINRKINVNDMISILNKYKELCSLRLNKYFTPNKKNFFLFSGNWKYIEEDKFYLCENWEKQFGLNPILIKKEFIKQALPKFRDNVNPEKQFRSSQKYMVDVIKNWKYGLFSKPGDEPLIIDIGREWIKNSKFKKPKGAFIRWEI